MNSSTILDSIKSHSQTKFIRSLTATAVTLSIAAVCFSLISCSDTVPKEEYDKIQKELSQVEDLKNKQEKQFNETLELMTQIEHNLSEIDRSKQEILGNRNSRDRAMMHIHNIDSLIKANYAMIGTLQNRIASSKLDVEALKEQVTGYEISMKGKESEIEKMRSEIAVLHTEKVELQKNIAHKEESIKQKELAISTKQIEISRRDSIIQSNERKYKVNQAEALVTLGDREEKLGDKISGIFNPQKKKDYYLNAHKHYQDAASLGSEEAKERIDKLKTKAKL